MHNPFMYNSDQCRLPEARCEGCPLEELAASNPDVAREVLAMVDNFGLGSVAKAAKESREEPRTFKFATMAAVSGNAIRDTFNKEAPDLAKDAVIRIRELHPPKY